MMVVTHTNLHVIIWYFVTQPFPSYVTQSQGSHPCPNYLNHPISWELSPTLKIQPQDCCYQNKSNLSMVVTNTYLILWYVVTHTIPKLTQPHELSPKPPNLMLIVTQTNPISELLSPK